MTIYLKVVGNQTSLDEILTKIKQNDTDLNIIADWTFTQQKPNRIMVPKRIHRKSENWLNLHQQIGDGNKLLTITNNQNFKEKANPKIPFMETKSSSLKQLLNVQEIIKSVDC